VTGVIDLAGISAIDDHTRDAICDGALGQIFDTELHVRGSGVGPQIIFDEQNESEILHGGEVQAFVGHAGGLSAIADVGHDGDVLPLQTCAQRDTCQNWDQIAQGRNRRDDVALQVIAEMR
jgi:hypothetical protein